MKKVLTMIAAFMPAALGNKAFTQKYSTDDYNLRKVYDVLKEDNDMNETLVKDWKAAVGDQRAPLLFGQSAMERFGTITIDNEKNKLIIKH